MFVGSGNYYAYYVRTDISSGTITYKLYAYLDSTSTPDIYIWPQPYSFYDTNFLVGKQLHDGKYYKHYQFGVESNTYITELQWEVLNDKPCFYESGYWIYCPAYVCWGNNAYIIWKGTTRYLIGGLTYTGVNIKYKATDTVWWKRTGSTVGDNTLLWSATGYVNDPLSTPYQ